MVDFRVASAYEAARIAATRLGLPWPLLGSRPSPPAIADTPGDLQEAPVSRTEVEATFLVLAPEYSPDSVTMRFAVPHAVADSLGQIDAGRSSLGRRLFPVLYPVHPQPDVRWGLVVAAPSWLRARVILCLDLTLIDGRIFSTVAPPDLDKHILLNMAGLSGGAAVEVYLGDSDEPAEYGAVLFVSNGDCISFVPAGEPLEFRCSLQAMLSAPFGWAGGPAFPQAPPGDRFCVVSEGLYFDFLIYPDRGALYRSDLARRLGVPANMLCLQPAAPRQQDVTLYGRHCRTVICAGSSPRRNEDDVALLDCRPILEGWGKVFTTDRWLDVGALRRSLALAAPEGFVVELSGCCTHWNWLWLNPGQVVVVSYVTQDQIGLEASRGPRHEESADGADPDGTSGTAHFGKGTYGTPSPPQSTTEKETMHTPWTGWNALGSTFSRFGDAWDAIGFLTPSRQTCLRFGICLCSDFASLVRGVVKWGSGFLGHAKSSGIHDPTSVTLPSPDLDTPLEVVHCKLLEEPVDMGSVPDHALQGARTAARALGVGWPFPPYRWTMLPPDEEDTDRASLADADMVTDVVFYLLTPGFTGEQVSTSMILPQTAGDALDIVQTRRSAARRELFPVLVPVTPQLDLGWGVALAVPAWVQNRVIVCLDLSLFDNRIVPADVPAHADYHSLCESAGLAPDTDADIYLPGAAAPLPRGLDCQLWTGACIAFVPSGSRRPEAFDLGAMLRTHLGWEQNPTLPRDSLDNGYCIVGRRGQCLFRLHADRARLYQSDVALLVDVRPDRVVLTPASEQPMNVCVNGWDCRAVVAATDRQERYDWSEGRATARVGLLDCRAALLGWLVVHTWDDWLLLDPIRRHLDLSAPEGWHTIFPQFPRDWTWIWFQPGQIILVAYAADAPVRSEPARTVIDTPGPAAVQPDESPGGEPPFPSAQSEEDAMLPLLSDRRPLPSGLTETEPAVLSPTEAGLRPCNWEHLGGENGKWSLGHRQDANSFGTLSLTPAAYLPEFSPFGFLGTPEKLAVSCPLLWNLHRPAHRAYKLLQEPVRTGTPADRAFDRARAGTRLLGVDWPLPPYAWPLDANVTDDDDYQDAVEAAPGLFDLSFYLLTPDYTFEQLDLSVVLPQTLWDVLEVVQTCRQAERASFFPNLIPVVPQPDPGWGILIAAPAWPSLHAIVCCDLSFYDGRIIAVCVPRWTDSHLLCELVGLSPLAEVDIYLPYATVPLRRGDECDLNPGSLVTFLRPGSQRPPHFRHTCYVEFAFGMGT